MDGTATRLTSQPSADGASRLRPLTVLKLGGSLARDGAHVALLETITELTDAGHELVIVPGGGAFADAVRRQCDVAAMSPTAAHWMAVLAMDQMAYLLAGCRRARVVRTGSGITRALQQRRVPILAPFHWLRAADPLPHSWDVTSDSIAAWAAARLGARRLVLLKSVDGVRNDADVLLPVVARTAIAAVAERGTCVVDRYFARALAGSTECWIVSGRRPERLRALLEHGTATGTLVSAGATAGSHGSVGVGADTAFTPTGRRRP